MKAAVGNHQTLSIMAVRSRPKPAGHDWPLYGDEYGRMKFGNYQEETGIGFQGTAGQPLIAVILQLPLIDSQAPKSDGERMR